jgi:arylformamidase
MQIYDISLPITPDLPVWPGDPNISMRRVMKMEDGEQYNLTLFSASVHMGTHVDAPYHFLGGNTDTIEALPLKILIGRTYLQHLPDQVELITADVLQQAGIPPRTRRILFRTKNSKYWARGVKEFQKQFTAFSADGAQYLIERGIKLVGIDYFSIAPFDDPVPAHQTFLRGGVIVVEGLDLSKVPQGRYSLQCLPLKLVGSDGAPARVILVGVGGQ